MLRRFSKADPRIQYNLLGVDSATAQTRKALGKKLFHLARDVGVGRVELHGLGSALHVEADVTGAGLGHDAPEGLVLAIGGDVVHDTGSSLEGGAGNGGFHSVNGYRHGDAPD